MLEYLRREKKKKKKKEKTRGKMVSLGRKDKKSGKQIFKKVISLPQ